MNREDHSQHKQSVETVPCYCAGKPIGRPASQQVNRPKDTKNLRWQLPECKSATSKTVQLPHNHHRNCFTDNNLRWLNDKPGTQIYLTSKQGMEQTKTTPNARHSDAMASPLSDLRRHKLIRCPCCPNGEIVTTDFADRVLKNLAIKKRRELDRIMSRKPKSINRIFFDVHYYTPWKY